MWEAEGEMKMAKKKKKKKTVWFLGKFLNDDVNET